MGRLIDAVVTVDSVPVVRCKDCMHKEQTQPGMVYCPNMVGGWVVEDWFCAAGMEDVREWDA